MLECGVAQPHAVGKGCALRHQGPALEPLAIKVRTSPPGGNLSNGLNLLSGAALWLEVADAMAEPT